MKPEQFLQALRKNSYTKKDGWGKIINAIKTLKLEKQLFDEINPLISSPNVKEADIKKILG